MDSDILYYDIDVQRRKRITSALAPHFNFGLFVSRSELILAAKRRPGVPMLVGVRKDGLHEATGRFAAYRSDPALRDRRLMLLHDGSIQPDRKPDGEITYIQSTQNDASILKSIMEVVDRRKAEAPEPAAEVFTGTSEAIREATAFLDKCAASPHPVLILGETGCGKDVAARAIHARSARREGPYLAVNCAALPDTLVESELFGTEKGAFTDAVDRNGAFFAASGGTLFLDEIGSLSREAQPRLLRVLENGEYRRLGGVKTERADIRLVAATCADLPALTRSNEFRADLYYRLAVLVLRIPPLRERPEDIRPIAVRFAREFSGGQSALDEGALEFLAGHAWPGNVRELRSVIARTVTMAGCRRTLGREDIILHP